jgi:hypothetical protein
LAFKNEIKMHTKNCITCGKPAVRWTGHIHTEMGQIISGWCDNHYSGNRPRSNRCTSTNPNSCGGEYKLAEIELKEELNEETMKQQRESEEFSNMIDSQCSPYHPRNKRKGFWKSIFG